MLGCAMSHLQIWNEIANNTRMNENDYYIVLEDDVHARYNPADPEKAHHFQTAFDEINKNAKYDTAWDLLYYGFTQDIDLYSDQWVWPNAKRFSATPRSHGGGGVCIRYSQKGALKLLKFVHHTVFMSP